MTKIESIDVHAATRDYHLLVEPCSTETDISNVPEEGEIVRNPFDRAFDTIYDKWLGG